MQFNPNSLLSLWLLSILLFVAALVLLLRELKRRQRIENELLAIRETLEQRVQDRTAEIQRFGEQRAFLVEFSAALDASLDYKATLQAIADRIVPRLADWCLLEARDTNRSMVQLAAAHVEPAKSALAMDMRTRYPLDKHAQDDIFVRVFQEGRPLVIPEVSEQRLASLALNADDHLAMLKTLGVASLMIVPIIVDKHVLGTVTFVDSVSGRHFAPNDATFAEEVAARAGVALENALLYDQAQLARRIAEQNAARIARYQLIISALTQTLTIAEVLDVVVNQGISMIGAVAGSVTTLSPDGQFLEVVGATGYPQALLDEWQTFPLDSPALMALAVRRQAPVWVGSVAEAEALQAPVNTPNSAHGHQAWAAIPLIADGQVIGAMGLSFAAPQSFTDDDKAFIISMTLKCAQALIRARLYEATIEQREQFRVTLASIGDAVIATDARGHITFMNPVAQKLTGWENDTGLGHELHEVFRIISETTRETVENPFTKVMRAGSVVGLANHTLLIAKDGSELPIDDSGAPIRDERKRIKGVVLIFRDITQRRRQEAQLEKTALENQRLFIEEKRARQEAERANEVRLKFLAMISHELRTPLTSIKGFASTMLATDVEWDAESQREFISIINDEANKLTDLIEQLLDLSRLQAGKLSIHPEPKPVSDIIRIARPQLEFIAANNKLVIGNTEDLPLVLVDPQRIAQVLVNLVGNAVKFSPPHTPVTVSFTAGNPELQIDVSDEGPGIPINERDRAFEAFSQLLDPINKQKTQGAGLGLAICRGLVEAHGGRIWIADRPVPGTTVAFTVPVVHTERQA